MPKRSDPYVIDYDGNWKEITTVLIDDFIAYFLPQLHQDRDLTKAVDFLEQELHDIIPENERDKVVDKLARVTLVGGEQRWLLIHIEFQTAAESDFAARMYTYYQRIRAKYNNQPLTSLVIYTGKRKPRIFDHYKEESYGTSVVYKFNTYQVAKQNEAELLANPNPFALVVLANYYVLKTTARQIARLTFKEHLYDLARNRGYSDIKTSSLLLFVSDLMQLNPLLYVAFKEYIYSPYLIGQAMKYSHDTIEFVNAQTMAIFGTTVEEAQSKVEEAQSKVEEAQSKVEEAQSKVEEAQSRAKDASNKLRKSVLILYQQVEMSIADIAAHLGEDPATIEQLLADEN